MPRLDFTASRPTAAYIALHARRRPDRVAVICDDRETTYAALHREVRAMTAALSRLGLQPGAIVAVEHLRLHPRLLVTLAFEQLGVTVAPFRVDEGEALDAFLATVDLVMSGSGFAAGDGTRVLHITDAWLAEALSCESLVRSPPPVSGRDPVLLQRTSGSTRQAKQIMLTRAMLAARVAQGVVCQDFHQDDRFLATMHFSVGRVYVISIMCLKLGATVMSHQDLPMAHRIDIYRPTQIYMLPYQLAALLEQSGTVPRLPGLQLTLAGGKLAPAFLQLAVECLCGRVLDLYGANEAGLICTLDLDGVGRPVRGTTIEVVDDDGVPVRDGEVGEVRVRSVAMFDGYHGDEAATAATLRDGWWHTGDFAMAMPDGCMKLLGRRDDILNFGGVKRATADVEAEIHAFAECDLAVLAARDANGQTVAAVCVAAEAPAARRLAGMIQKSLIGRFAVYTVATIPRTPEGKLRRAVLRHDIAQRAPLSPLLNA